MEQYLICDAVGDRAAKLTTLHFQNTYNAIVILSPKDKGL